MLGIDPTWAVPLVLLPIALAAVIWAKVTDRASTMKAPRREV